MHVLSKGLLVLATVRDQDFQDGSLGSESGQEVLNEDWGRSAGFVVLVGCSICAPIGGGAQALVRLSSTGTSTSTIGTTAGQIKVHL